jgi:hypothetical protein
VTGPDYAARAAAGAAFLDERRPGWAERIDLDTLALIDECYCVLGQLGGNYAQELSALGLSLGDEADLGFIPAGHPGDWSLLDAAWTAEIRQRRETAQVAS